MASLNYGKPAGDGSLYIIKSDSRIELFDPNKVVVSLIKSGVPYRLACDIADDLQYRIHDGITTKSLRTILLNIIDQKDPEAALRVQAVPRDVSCGRRVARWSRSTTG